MSGVSLLDKENVFFSVKLHTFWGSTLLNWFLVQLGQSLLDVALASCYIQFLQSGELFQNYFELAFGEGPHQKCANSIQHGEVFLRDGPHGLLKSIFIWTFCFF